MAAIVPFCGIHIDPNRIANPGSILIPPYDCIDEEEKIRFYAENPYNVVRLAAGVKFPTDNEHNNQITRATRYFSHWMEEGVLIEDSSPALYVVEMATGISGSQLLGLLALTPGRDLIVPEHAEIRIDEEKLRLLTALGLSVTPILALYSDPVRSFNTIIKSQLAEKEPLLIGHQDGQEVRLYAITEDHTISIIQKRMEEKTLYVGAGFNLYRTHMALNEQTPHPLLTMICNSIDLGIALEEAADFDLGLTNELYRRIPVGLVMSRFLPKTD